VVVTDAQLGSIARGSPPPSMCDPRFAPDGRWIAFTGVIPNRDGRVDVYAANNNGFGAVNLTGSLLGTIDMLGWVGGG
jgi:Tol biopolymer transport system component